MKKKSLVEKESLINKKLNKINSICKTCFENDKIITGEDANLQERPNLSLHDCE